MITVATHVHPDWDAIAAAWMVGQWKQQPITVVFVNAGEHGHSVADYTVDTGGGAFDHHHLPNNTTSATELVYHAATVGSTGTDLEHLAPLVALITAADLGKDEHGAKESRALGIHALLSAQHALGTDDATICRMGFGVLDRLAAHLRRDYEARRDAEQWIKDRFNALGRSIAVFYPNAPRGLTQICYEMGYDVVFFESTYQQERQTRYTRGMSRKEGSAIHCGDMVARFLHRPGCDLGCMCGACTELAAWYVHPSGFFAGISEKGGGTDQPLAVPLQDIARAIFL
jgi:hypothetical protein